MIDRRARTVIDQSLPRPSNRVLFACDLNQTGKAGAARLFDARGVSSQEFLDREAITAINQFTQLRALGAVEFQEIGDAVEKIHVRKRDAKTAEAEQSFRTAIEIARKQKARGWELRATTSLARLLRDANRREEARTLLADIYNWFTEGFDTADLKDAKALLDELSGSP